MIPALQFGNAFVVQRSGNPKSPESLDTAALQLKDHIDGLGVDTFVRLGGDCGFRTMFTGPKCWPLICLPKKPEACGQSFRIIC